MAVHRDRNRWWHDHQSNCGYACAPLEHGRALGLLSQVSLASDSQNTQLSQMSWHCNTLPLDSWMIQIILLRAKDILIFLSCARCSFRRNMESLVCQFTWQSCNHLSYETWYAPEKGIWSEVQVQNYVKNGCHIQAKFSPTRFDEVIL